MTTPQDPNAYAAERFFNLASSHSEKVNAELDAVVSALSSIDECGLLGNILDDDGKPFTSMRDLVTRGLELPQQLFTFSDE